MLLKRFVQMFGRVQPADMATMEQTQLCFTINDIEVALTSVQFDTANNAWIVKLAPPKIEDETIGQAIESLRTPSYVFNQVPNAVRQSLADMIELMLVRGRGDVQ
jgi:hypothetical protein